MIKSDKKMEKNKQKKNIYLIVFSGFCAFKSQLGSQPTPKNVFWKTVIGVQSVSKDWYHTLLAKAKAQ